MSKFYKCKSCGSVLIKNEHILSPLISEELCADCWYQKKYKPNWFRKYWYLISKANKVNLDAEIAIWATGCILVSIPLGLIALDTWIMLCCSPIGIIYKVGLPVLCFLFLFGVADIIFCLCLKIKKNDVK